VRIGASIFAVIAGCVGRMNKVRKFSAFCILHSAFCILLPGCGYQQSGVYDRNITPGYQWHSLYREDIQTVAVPVFVNTTYQKGIEMQLTRAIVEQMEAHSPYKVVSPQKADTILEGQISAAGTATLSNDPHTGLPQEQQYTITVSFTWKNLRTGQILVKRDNFDQRASFFPTLGEGEVVGSQDAVDKLALGIVQELQADW
jgi:Lipopolysaccharide-assembly